MDKNHKVNNASEGETKTARRKKQELKTRGTQQLKDESSLSSCSKEIEESTVNIEEVDKELQTDKTKKSKRNKGSEDTKLSLNKKIKFDNNDSEELQKKHKNPKKKKFNDAEAEIKDEDIDNFCDELDEEDNKQYENWVQLFEANFRSKKKS